MTTEQLDTSQRGNMEQKLKLQIGEMVLTLISLQDQLEQANVKIAELQKEQNEK